MKESPLRGPSAHTAGQRYLAGMQEQNPVRAASIFQSGFCAVMETALGSSTKTAFAVNAESHIQERRSSVVMYELKVITSFSAAHQLKNFHGACENLHGHNWKIEICVTSEVLNEADIVVDFRVLKQHVNSVMARLDHKFLNDLEAFKDQNPSSENIARYVAEQLSALLQAPEIKVSSVTAWESETACATYYPS
jgi:6-pyruvoyltetrahydropterin/6-carboxytetrahydropterin synthase